VSTHPTIAALRPYLNAWGWDHPQEVLAALSAVKPRHGIILAPSHVLPAQASRILQMPSTTISYRVKHGNMASEVWWQTTMIPMSAVMAELKKKEP
jgi:hypothetical protein